MKKLPNHTIGKKQKIIKNLMGMFTSQTDFNASTYFYITNNALASKVVFNDINNSQVIEHLLKAWKISPGKCIRTRSWKGKFKTVDTYVPINRYASLHFTNNSQAVLYYDPNKIDDEFIEELGRQINIFPEKPGKQFVNLVVAEYGELILQKFPIERTEIDIDNHYNDDFANYDVLIKKNLGKDKEKGLILLHGSPGTGKTSYIRHLISTINRKFIYIPPNMACNISEPSFITFLTSHPDTVLVIEDAEEILANRNGNNNSAISNLLNLF